MISNRCARVAIRMWQNPRRHPIEISQLATTLFPAVAMRSGIVTPSCAGAERFRQHGAPHPAHQSVPVFRAVAEIAERKAFHSPAALFCRRSGAKLDNVRQTGPICAIAASSIFSFSPSCTRKTESARLLWLRWYSWLRAQSVTGQRGNHRRIIPHANQRHFKNSRFAPGRAGTAKTISTGSVT